MDEIKLIERGIERYPTDPAVYHDGLAVLYKAIQGGSEEAMEYNKTFRSKVAKAMRTEGLNLLRMQRFSDIYKQSLLIDAPRDFDSYMLYIESAREPKKQFYLPRRKQLKQVVDLLQMLADDKLDVLGISLSPGVGKTTLAIFFLTWMAGKYPNEPMLTGSHNANFIRGVYDECLRILDPKGEYLWKDVFPGIGIVKTNAKDNRIDLGVSKRFETLEFTSIGAGNAGLYRASRLLYCDDLVPGVEVAMSKERLDKLWNIYTTDLRQRKIGDHCKELHIATRWSVHDVIGRLERYYEGDERAQFLAVPALNEKDESNFDYKYGVGFTTEFYHEQRAIMEDVDWRALYMNMPIEREGQLYHPDELRRFFELPDGKPDGIICVCDTKDKGSDYACMPIVYIFGQDLYVADVIFDNGKPEVVEERLAQKLVEHHVQMGQFESNSAGGHIAEKVSNRVRELGGKTHITTRYTTENKETKIVTNSPEVKRRCLFLDETKYTAGTDYGRFMNNLVTYSMVGKNKHDDAPDGMAMLMIYMDQMMGGKAEVFQRPW